MRIDVFTIFPEVVTTYCGVSVLGRAVEAGALDMRAHDLREGAVDARAPSTTALSAAEPAWC